MPNATLKKIAEMLNISISTVSRALKNHPDISDTTRKKVQELAALLEYEPNAYAIHLRTNNSKLFGVILPTVSNYFYHSFIATLEEEVRRFGYSLLILQSGDNASIEQDNIRLCRTNRVAGIFVCITPETKNFTALQKMEEQGVPVIYFDKVPPASETCNKVCMADAEAAKIAAETLVKSGRKKILALFGNPEMSISAKRLDSFNAVFQQQTAAKVTVDYAYSSDEAHQVTLKHFSKKSIPDAVFCMSDEILIGVHKALQEKSVQIPKQTALIAISNGFIPKLFYPEINYVETSGSKLASLCFNRMMSCLAGSSFIQELTVDAVYVKGGSVN